MISRKFTNHRNQVYLKSEELQPTVPVSALRKNNPLLKFPFLMTGRELFCPVGTYRCFSAIISTGKY